jgi:hypothetical protein
MDVITQRLPMKDHPGPINKQLMAAQLDGPTWKVALDAYARVREAVESGGAKTHVIINAGDLDSGVAELSHIVATHG